MIEPEELREGQNNAMSTQSACRRAGLTISTDGEFRRPDFPAGFTEQIVEMPWHGLSGVEIVPTLQYMVTERLEQRRRLTEEVVPRSVEFGWRSS